MNRDGRREDTRERAILSSPGVMILRLGPLERWILSGIFVGFFGWVGIEQVLVGDSIGWALGLAIILTAITVGWLVSFRFLLAYTEDEVLVRNVRSRTVRRDEIIRAEPTYEGLVLRLANGRKMTALAVQQYNIALFLGRQSRADRIARALILNS